MLHHDNGVAFVAKMTQRAEEFIVVSLMQPDGGLVEDVDHVHEARTYLGGETDTLALAAAERTRGAVESEVFQADVDQEPHTVAQFLENIAGNCGGAAGEV